MPKATRPARRLKYVPLEMKDRDALAVMLNSPVMQRALANVETQRPSVFGEGVSMADAKDAAMATLKANNRLHELRGWELFVSALFLQTAEPKVQREEVEETFPDDDQTSKK